MRNGMPSSSSQAKSLTATVRQSVQDWKAKYQQFYGSLSNQSSRHDSSNPQYVRPLEKPPLESILSADNKTIVGDVQSLLDFAIVAFAKTGTTNLLHWLELHPEIAIPPVEVHELSEGRPADFVQELYKLPYRHNVSGKLLQRGYKAPREIGHTSIIDNIQKYWPNIKLIIGVRHPVLWFESFYNFREHHNTSMPDPNRLIGECMLDVPNVADKRRVRQRLGPTRHDHGVCTDLARFHVRLSWLGKTNVLDPEENELLGMRRHFLAPSAPLRHKIFLYDLEQLKEVPDDPARHYQRFQVDLQQFLNLKQPLPPQPTELASIRFNTTKYKYPLDICDPPYANLRNTLLEHGNNAATWIIRYFMNHPDVTVSSPVHFRQLLKSWSVDPCLTRGNVKPPTKP